MATPMIDGRAMTASEMQYWGINPGTGSGWTAEGVGILQEAISQNVPGAYEAYSAAAPTLMQQGLIGITQLEVPALLPGGTGSAAGGASVISTLLKVLGYGAAGYEILQALGLGEGEGLFGLDILGGTTDIISGVQIAGPGVPEPTQGVMKQWKANGCYFYLVQTPYGKKVMCYNPRTKSWKSWRPYKNAVIGKNMPSHKTLTRLRRYLKRQTADAKTILKLTSPNSLAKPKRRRR